MVHIGFDLVQFVPVVTDVPGDCSSCHDCRHLGHGFCYCAKREGIETCRQYGRRFLSPEATESFDWSFLEPQMTVATTLKDSSWMAIDAHAQHSDEPTDIVSQWEFEGKEEIRHIFVDMLYAYDTDDDIVMYDVTERIRYWLEQK